MLRHFLIGAIIGLIVGIGILAVSIAAQAMPQPDPEGSDCSWQEHGKHEFVGDREYLCLCARLNGPMGPQILCRWHATDALPAAARRVKKHAKKKPPWAPGSRLTHGIGTAVTWKAPA